MNKLATTLLQDGFVRVPGALDTTFCEAVVRETLASGGLDQGRIEPWPTGAVHLPVRRNWGIEEVAPAAYDVLLDLVGPSDRLDFAGIQDNLIVNLRDPFAAGGELGGAGR